MTRRWALAVALVAAGHRVEIGGRTVR